MDEKLNDVISIDSTDTKIIKLLNEDGRMSYRKISRELDISVGTVHNRVDKLLSTGVIKKFVPFIDLKKLGYNLTAIIGVRAKGGVLKHWETKSIYRENIVGIYDVTGQFDAILIAKFRDMGEMDRFVKNLMKEPGVQRTYTFTVLNTIKEEIVTSQML